MPRKLSNRPVYRDRRALGICVALIVTSILCATPSAALMLERIKLPAGFSVSIFAANVANARQMARLEDDLIFVGTRRAGSVYAITDRDRDFVADEVHTVATDLYMPSGVALRHDTLFVAEVNRVIAFDGIRERYLDAPAPRTVFDQLPTDAHHGWKFIAFGPDDKLYIPVGAPCNVCAVEPPYGTIIRLDISTGTTETVARGIRNSVGFDWHPTDQALWFSDNGRDMMGDDVPPGELNRVQSAAQHFGFPNVHGGDIIDPQFGQQGDETQFAAPALKLGAHVAPLGLLFYTGEQFPSEYRNTLLVAEHGSWNRSRKSGYRVMRATIDDDGTVVAYEPFMTGWLLGQAHWGRPVDIEQLSDGSILISDDHAGVIYRVSYSPP